MEASSTSRESMFSAEASRSCAKTSPTPAVAQGSTEPARVFGPSSLDSLASYDPATSSWRTSQLCLDGEQDEFSGTWPRSGMTRNGIAFQRQPLAPLTGGTASGLLPTPEASNTKAQAMRSGGRPPRDFLKAWPTPNARDWKGPPGRGCQERGGHQSSMELTKDGLLTTPCADDTGHRKGKYAQGGTALSAQAGGSLNPTWVEVLMGFPPTWTDLAER